MTTVVEAWGRVMADVQAVGKTGHNQQQDYNFRGIDAVVNAAGPAMREHGVIVVPTVLDATYRDIEVGKNRTLMREVTVKVRYTIIGPDGDALTAAGVPGFGCVYGESMDSGDKGTAKAMSVAYRIFLLQALTIPTSEPDPDESTFERAPAQDPWWLSGGWSSEDEAQHEIDAYVAAAKELPPEGQAHLRAYRASHDYPWPPTREQLGDLDNALSAWVNESGQVVE